MSGERPGRCGICGKTLPTTSGPGRPRLFCSDACRQQNYIQRVILNGSLIAELGERDGWRCYLCGEQIDPKLRGGPWAPCFDHLIPVSWGGQAAPENLSVVHVDCNLKKGQQIRVDHPMFGSTDGIPPASGPPYASPCPGRSDHRPLGYLCCLAADHEGEHVATVENGRVIATWPEPTAWYVLVCRVCDPEGDAPMPFDSAAKRGRWASEHTRGTGHDLWLVLDQPKPEALT